MTDFAMLEGCSTTMNMCISFQKECGCEYTFVPTGAFYEARVCSDADLLDTVLNMLERM